VSTQSRHPEVAEPQPNRSMQNLECYPAFGSSGSINAVPQGKKSSLIREDLGGYQSFSDSKVETHPLPLPIKGGEKRAAFTLAEVLITLAIIGVVAAMTIPTLVANYQKKVVVTKLQKFYSTMSQSIKMSEAVNSDFATWNTDFDNLSPESLYDWYKKYLSNFFRGEDIVKTNDGIIVTMADGSAFGMYKQGNLMFIYFVDYEAAQKFINNSGNNLYDVGLDGKNNFLFEISDSVFQTYYNKDVNGPATREILMNGGAEWTARYGCAKSYKAYCTKLIEYDGWQIKDDYPW